MKKGLNGYEYKIGCHSGCMMGILKNTLFIIPMSSLFNFAHPQLHL